MSSFTAERGFKGEWSHGTRARYVALRCRCSDCRGANTQYARDQAARRKERAATIRGEQPPPLTKPHGELVRTYKRACIGILDGPCPFGTYLRKDSTGDICSKCRVRRSFSGLVPADEARRHLLELQRQGVGKVAVHDACDVALTILHDIRLGHKARIRVETEARILGVDVAAIADSALVPAGETWRLLDQLLGLGIPKYKLARALGSKAQRAMPALQFKKGFVLAKTEQRIRRAHAELLGHIRRAVEMRDELRGAAAKGSEWFERDSYSVIRRGGSGRPLLPTTSSTSPAPNHSPRRRTR